MKEDAIIAILELRIKRISRHFLKLQKGLDPEELHDFRLEMKKLKAFLRLLNTGKSHGKKIRLSEDIKKYYSLTGNLRNLQLYEQRIKRLVDERHLATPVAYLALLEQETVKTIEQLKPTAEKISFQQLRKKVLEFVPSRLDASDCKYYLLLQQNALAALLIPVTNRDEALHEVRKIVKDIGYNRDYISSYMSLFLPIFLIKKEQTDAIAEKLGVFHDLCVSLYLIQLPIAKQVKEQGERAVLQELESIIESDKRKMKVEVMQQLSSV
jgi:CHAD domain-containing protein